MYCLSELWICSKTPEQRKKGTFYKPGVYQDHKP